jgi:hypothetical protein
MRFVLALLLLAICAFAPAFAQDGPAGVTNYPVGYFSANQPSTALDMVRLLPGFRLQNGDSGLRGFSGSVGNILIDGQLPTSKEESAEQLLQRIGASSVDHIELIRGAADMHGYAVLANVVRIDGASLSGRVEAEFAATHFGTSAPSLALHLTRQGADSTLDLSASYGREVQGMHGFGARGRFAPDGTPLRLSQYAFPELQNFADLSGTYRQGLWDGDLTLGLVLKQERDYSRIQEQIYFPAAALSAGLESDRKRNGEARLDYQRPVGDWGQLQLFAVHRLEEQDEISQTTTTTGTDLARSRYNQREDVARLAWQRQDGALKLESGAEGAINVLSSRSVLTLGGTPFILPAANLRVEEDRGEFFTTATWRFGPALVSELGARYEISTLRQSGDSNLTKDLSFFKPRWLTSWDFADGHQLRFLAERQVGQLEFRDFASSTSLNSNIVTAGNKNLEPQRTLLVALTWERHFWERASLTMEARHEMVSHVVDHVPVFAGSRVFDAVGNIGNGLRDVVQINLILPLDEVGLTGFTLTTDTSFAHSRVRDPATGVKRRFSEGEPFRINAELNYDIPEENLRLGVTFHDDARQFDYRIDEISSNYHGIKLGAFIEYKPTLDWTLRLFGEDLAQSAFFRDREIYSGLRGAVPLSQIEHRILNNGALVGIHVQRNF